MWLLVLVGWCAIGSGNAVLRFESQQGCEAARQTVMYFAQRVEGVAPFQTLNVLAHCETTTREDQP